MRIAAVAMICFSFFCAGANAQPPENKPFQMRFEEGDFRFAFDATTETVTKKVIDDATTETELPAQDAIVTEVITTPVDAKNFITLSAHILSPHTAVVLDSEHIAVSAPGSVIQKVKQSADLLRQSLAAPQKDIILKVTLLAAADNISTSTGEAISAQDLPRVFGLYDVAAEDLQQLNLPDQLFRVGDATAPVGKGGTVQLSLTETLSLTAKLQSIAGGRFSANLSLQSTDRAQWGPNSALLTNDFDAEPDKPVILGITNPKRTLVLLLLLDTK